ncbi:tRNA (adenosine(37)-N6)-threonylcarbamoyltransferase complex dimerization subunit type 1 TsaB [Comamonas aquatica]|uniref:tRNA (adenosine(37)-N6)-threonylcarbamoyltransferase complex dimerization subunit type 1 TsaB n=1 Tax=Comamonas aquatica TaxID=225991 RepID=UPI00244A55E4|nr:tRNA (adenosine(37)-N6)-threonylcarbamoyltransferase complex dimerization subunit type 1 TsaB [Comamonas aquatica]MDH0371030.1 tRNA (adenosine(37)-N6)-threonylcarbamoyltransferase complex dimerization subunit type 1 TsaB [Comamonas aquatica]MDH0898203.1 tRNA (adenosine(37)-N6)-threonylcarbamoyltransferase complex dimerization subunit type 1 TsaB [Comamonas aquatica]MDH1378686.1 tRNA (adenosine(37)-N6)-threonylcarbamoyltransferase complex dimerization subunit type 1 TsaB [Comamonas aquatica]M
MNLLAFDTSTDTLFIALQRGTALWQHQAAGGANSSATLLPSIQQGLQALGLQFADLDAIVFGRGPGSFTGLRTACAIAQGLALGASKPLLPVDTLLAVAEEAREQHGLTDVMAVLDARMSEVYHAGYRWAEGLWHATHALGLCAPEALQVPEGLSVVGNAQAAYAERLAPQAAHRVALPTATALLRLAPRLMADGHLVDASYALPLYIRDKVALTTAEREAARAASQPAPHA